MPDTKFKVGDRVKIIGAKHPWKGESGTVTAIESVGSFGLRPRVKLDESNAVYAGVECFVMDDSDARNFNSGV